MSESKTTNFPPRRTQLKPGMEDAVSRIATAICEAATCGGMSKEEFQELEQSLRDLAHCVLGNK